jgi:hypothetical protein
VTVTPTPSSESTNPAPAATNVAAKTTMTIAKGFPLLDRKIDGIIAGLEASVVNPLRSIIESNVANLVK